MSSAQPLPPGSIAAAAAAVGEVVNLDPRLLRRIAKAALEAGAPSIERLGRRDLARRILAVTATGNLYDTYYAMQRHLKSAARGEPLPAIPEEGSPS